MYGYVYMYVCPFYFFVYVSIHIYKFRSKSSNWFNTCLQRGRIQSTHRNMLQRVTNRSEKNPDFLTRLNEPTFKRKSTASSHKCQSLPESTWQNQNFLEREQRAAVQRAMPCVGSAQRSTSNTSLSPAVAVAGKTRLPKWVLTQHRLASPQAGPFTGNRTDFFSLNHLFLKISGTEEVCNSADGDPTRPAVIHACSAVPKGFPDRLHFDSATPWELSCRISIKC